MLRRAKSFLQRLFGRHAQELPTASVPATDAPPREPRLNEETPSLGAPPYVAADHGPEVTSAPTPSVQPSPAMLPARSSPPSPAPSPQPSEIRTPRAPSETGPSAPPAPAQPESPAPEPAPILLTDFRAVVYPVAATDFAAPPGTSVASPPNPEARRWTRKRFHHPPALAAEIIEDLRRRGVVSFSVRASEPIVALWPEPASAEEYSVPELDDGFLIRGGQHRGRPRTLDVALPGHWIEEGPAADAFDRLELVRLTAMLVEALHDQELVTAGLTWAALAFRLDPRPSVVLRQPGGVRRLGGESLEATLMPSGSTSSASALDSDRGDFALLAFQLLVAGTPDAPVEPHAVDDVPGLAPDHLPTLRRLWQRAVGPAGTRPQMGEWIGALTP